MSDAKRRIILLAACQRAASEHNTRRAYQPTSRDVLVAYRHGLTRWDPLKVLLRFVSALFHSEPQDVEAARRHHIDNVA